MQISNLVNFVHFCTYAKVRDLLYISNHCKCENTAIASKINAFLYNCNDSKIKSKFHAKKKIAYVQKIVQN